VRYAVHLAQATRPNGELAPDKVREYVAWGAGPRASQFLVVAARARALLRNRPAPDHEDVAAVAPGVLRHRMILSYAAEADGVDAETIVEAVLDHLPRPGQAARRETPAWRRWLAGLFQPVKKSA
jgi:MoxR-like ATPase